MTPRSCWGVSTRPRSPDRRSCYTSLTSETERSLRTVHIAKDPAGARIIPPNLRAHCYAVAIPHALDASP
jgi:hypothetical protein